MSIDLSSITKSPRLLFSILLRPVQGHRIQPTGFPNLGAAVFQTSTGQCLLVESTQSMANRLEEVVWDNKGKKPIEALKGISHVCIKRKGEFLTDTMQEPHRLNSAYLHKDKNFVSRLIADGDLGEGIVDQRKLANMLLKYDAGSLIHGVFLEKLGGRVRVARALSAFIEAEGVQLAASGGVKNDHVSAKGVAKDGFGNVIFARDEYTAEKITLYVNLDLALLRGYGLEDAAVRMLVLLSLYKLALFLEKGLRLRTACNLEYAGEGSVVAKGGFVLPSVDVLEQDLKEAIAAVSGSMVEESVSFNEKLKQDSDSAAEAGD